MYVLAFEDQNTFPKWNIFLLLLLVLHVGLSVAEHPPKVKYFFKAILMLVLSACVLHVLAFEDQNTLPKWNIFCYCSFFCILAFMYQKTPTTGDGERNWIICMFHTLFCA